MILVAGSILAATAAVHAQYVAPPPPAPFHGFINEWLRQDNPAMEPWDFGGAARSRYEVKQGFAIAGVSGSVDFRDHGADVDNKYFLERIRFHTGRPNGSAPISLPAAR
jgi:hypothetical protein